MKNNQSDVAIATMTIMTKSGRKSVMGTVKMIDRMWMRMNRQRVERAVPLEVCYYDHVTPILTRKGVIA